jgi:hypothetical protein
LDVFVSRRRSPKADVARFALVVTLSDVQCGMISETRFAFPEQRPCSWGLAQLARNLTALALESQGPTNTCATYSKGRGLYP